MPDPVGVQTPIEPSAYSEEYFRTSVEGHAEFAASGGRNVSPRLQRALSLANLGPGQRVLDIACGRGEVIVQCALRGGHALGIDYAAGALAVARDAVAGAEGASLARMDATQLALRPKTFDAAFMLDFVEHVYQTDLERALREVHDALRPGGRLIVHTSPNRIFEEKVWRYWVRNVHRVVLGSGRVLHRRNRIVNEWLLPTDALPPHDEYERELHVNPQSRASLRGALERCGYRVVRLDHWEPPAAPFFEDASLNRWLALLDVARFLRPLSRFAPLNRLFSNHVWVVAERT